MQIYAFNQGLSRLWLPPKLILIMKLIIIMMIATLTQVSAAGFAQKVSLNEKNILLKTIIGKIGKQTGYDFVFDSRLIGNKTRITVNLDNVQLEEALNVIFKNQNLDFNIKNKVIVLERKNTSFLDKIIEKFSAIDVGGTILDENGKKLAGATIKIKGSNRSVVSDKNGQFFLTGIIGNETLIVSYIGYEITELSLKESQNTRSLTIRLKLIVGQLNEVAIVNTGYQKLSREKITGSVVTIGAEELEKRNTVNILQNLEGIVPGLVLYRGNTTMRGVGTFQSNSNVLVVVDGLPIEGSIADLNPYDIESINVLKDAAATAIYGARASNGVIVVTTKRAKEKGKTTVEASSNFTITDKPDYSYRNFMAPAEQVDWASNYYNWWFNGAGGTVANPITTFENNLNTGSGITPIQYGYYQLKKGQINQSQLDGMLAELKTHDFAREYRDNALKNQAIQQYNFALRTNNGKSQNSLVVNYTTDNGGIINAFNKRLNLFYKGTYSLGKWLDIDYGVNSVIGKIRTHNSYYATNPFNVPAYYSLLNADHSRAYYTTNQINKYLTVFETTPGLYSMKLNHLDELERDFVNTTVLNTRYYVNLNFKVLKGLTINPMFQYEDNRRDVSAYSEAESYTMRWLHNAYATRSGTPGNYTYGNLLPVGGKLNTTRERSPNYTGRVQANYDREFGKHAFIGLAGLELRETRIYGQRGVLLGYDDQLQTQATNNVNFGTMYNVTGTFWMPTYPVRQSHFGEISDMSLIPDTRHRFASGYANLTYSYDKKYNLFGSVRKDYADIFGGDEKYRGRPLWSAGASWVASNEDFLKNLPALNYLKVRATYGLTGNIRTDVAAILTAINETNPITQLPNARVTNPPNPELRWEKTATSNIGIDFRLFDNRLRGALDLYRRKGTDLFALKRFDPSEGFTSMVVNNASMTNSGVELNLGYDWIRPSAPGNFGWSSNLSGAWNENKIVYVDELTRSPLSLASGGAYKVGYPVRSIFSFKFAGLTNTGIPQWYNAAGVPTTTALGPNDADAIVYSGSADPKVNLSFNNDFTYKGVSLSVFAVYYGGHYFRARPIPAPLQNPFYSQLPSYISNSWTPTNTETDIPGSGQYYQTPKTTQYNYSDNLVRSADFIKIRSIVMGYTIPNAIASKIKASNLKLRFQLNNPKSIWIKQKDVHVDPETLSGAPVLTSYVFGFTANF
jgi:TonB-linked SusC/RagA family outer membrane protein